MPGRRDPDSRLGFTRVTRLAMVTLAFSLAQATFAQQAYSGRSVQAVLEEVRSTGVSVVYSSSLVPADLTVEAEPVAREPLNVLEEILAPHGLGLRYQDGVYVVVRRRMPSTADPSEPLAQTQELDEDDGRRPLENVMVSASRYLLQSASQFYIDQRAIQALPDLGEDPIRSAHRLPGTAASGLSSKSHFRGGAHDETAIYLNGLQLLDPFHIRDYHSIFSTIDARAVSGMEAYTGGFPAQYGGNMSGVLSLETQRPEDARHTELGVSVYNTSVLHMGYDQSGDWDWLISARESNLDLVLNPDIGSPDYFDVFAQLGHRFSETAYLTVNALFARDSVVVITESDPEELEQSDSDTQSAHFWIRLDNDWTPDLSSSALLSWSALENLRVAEMNDPDKMVARALDRREAGVLGVRQDWRWAGWPAHNLHWGLEYRDQDADYHYAGAASYDGLQAGLPRLQNPRAYTVIAAPEGYGASLYLSDRWNLNQSTWVQYGLRWDRQTWTGAEADDQISPRVSFLHSLDPKTDVRLSWGRYYQPQAIHHLQVEDDVDRFFAPQRSDHFILGFRREFSNGYRLRAEAFLKQYDRVKPRFENLFDPLALIPELAPDRVRLDPDSAKAKGFELTLEYRGRGELEWWMSYALSRATDRISGRNQARSWDQRHAIQTGASWQRGPWEIGAALSTHSGWPTTPLFTVYEPDQEEFIPIPGPRNSVRFRTFWTLDFRISREFEVKFGHLSAFLEVSNATNRDNPCCIDYDIDDEVDPATVDRSVDYWLPLIPAVGILWEF